VAKAVRPAEFLFGQQVEATSSRAEVRTRRWISGRLRVNDSSWTACNSRSMPST
jgi:hypothetical protein